MRAAGGFIPDMVGAVDGMSSGSEKREFRYRLPKSPDIHRCIQSFSRAEDDPGIYPPVFTTLPPCYVLASVAMVRYRDSNFSKACVVSLIGIGYVDTDIQMLSGARSELHCSTT